SFSCTRCCTGPWFCFTSDCNTWSLVLFSGNAPSQRPWKRRRIKMINSFAHVLTGPSGVRSRRGFLAQLAAGTAAGVASLSWRDMLIAKAEKVRKQGKSMILLWMDGGPSQFDTFNPKIGSQFQGPAKAIPTNVPGVDFAEYWPQTAQVMDKI